MFYYVLQRSNTRAQTLPFRMSSCLMISSMTSFQPDTRAQVLQFRPNCPGPNCCSTDTYWINLMVRLYFSYIIKHCIYIALCSIMYCSNSRTASCHHSSSSAAFHSSRTSSCIVQSTATTDAIAISSSGATFHSSRTSSCIIYSTAAAIALPSSGSTSASTYKHRTHHVFHIIFYNDTDNQTWNSSPHLPRVGICSSSST